MIVAQDALIRVRTLQKDSKVHNLLHVPMLPIHSFVVKWEALIGDMLKLNADAAWRLIGRQGVCGVNVHGSEGMV